MESRSSSVRGRKTRCAARKVSTRAPPAERSRPSITSALYRTEFQRVVEAAQPVAAKVDRHMSVAERAQRPIDLAGHGGIQRPGDFLAPELETRGRVVVPNAEDTEAETLEDSLGLVDGAQLLRASLPSGTECARTDRPTPARSRSRGPRAAPAPARRPWRNRARRADSARRTPGRPDGRDDSRPDRRRCCRRRRRRTRGFARWRSAVYTARVCSSSSGSPDSRGRQDCRLPRSAPSRGAGETSARCRWPGRGGDRDSWDCRR